MKRIALFGIFLAALLAVTSPVSGQSAPGADPVGVDTLSSDRPILLFFTATWCGPCSLVKNITFKDPEVAALLSRFEVRMLDIDQPRGKSYRELYGSERGGVPELILLDRNARKIASLAGFRKNPRETADFLRQGIPAAESEADSLLTPVTLTYDVSQAGIPARIPFLMKLAYSPWSLCFEGGVSFAQIAASDYDSYRTGFYVAATANCNFTRRWSGETGLMFNALGGKSSGDVIRSYYLTLPAEVQYNMFRAFGVRVIAAGGLYGACLVGSAVPEGVSPGRWDAGVRARLIFEAGSFRLSAGYNRGLVHCLRDKGYNQGFTIGVALCLGK